MNAPLGTLRVGASVTPGRPVVEVVTSHAGFLKLETEWNALAARSASPHQVFQDFGFLLAWAESYGADSLRLAVVVLRQDGRLRAALPLVRQRHFGLAALHVMGAPIARFNDLLVDGELDVACRAALAEGIAGLDADLIYAPLVRDDSSFCALGLDRNAAVIARLSAPFACLEARVNGEEPGEAYPPKMRSNYRRRARKLAGDDELAMRRYAPGPQAVALVHEAIRIKRDWLTRQGMAAPAVFDPRFEACFAAFAAITGGQASLQVSTLERGGRPIGIDLSFDFKGRSFGHVIATEGCAEKDGAGSVLVHHVFAGAKARGSAIFELLTPADEHKMRHADGVVGVRDLAIPLSARGRAVCAALTYGLPAAKALARRLPAGLVRLLAGKA